jgi:hypothetical protein
MQCFLTTRHNATGTLIEIVVVKFSMLIDKAILMPKRKYVILLYVGFYNAIHLGSFYPQVGNGWGIFPQ